MHACKLAYCARWGAAAVTAAGMGRPHLLLLLLLLQTLPDVTADFDARELSI